MAQTIHYAVCNDRLTFVYISRKPITPHIDDHVDHSGAIIGVDTDTLYWDSYTEQITDKPQQEDGEPNTKLEWDKWNEV